MAKRTPARNARSLQPANLFAEEAPCSDSLAAGAGESAPTHSSNSSRSDQPAAELLSAASDPALANLVQQASAGTGKTFALSNRFLRLLVRGVAPDSILASTFTRKGAGEILDRIVSRLGAAAGSDSKAAKLASELELPLTRAEATQLLRKMVDCLATLQIGTLDGFFNRIARAFCFELGLPPDWTVVDPLRARVVHEQAIEAILGDQATPQLLRLMSKAEADRRVADMVATTVDELFVVYRDSTAEAWDQFGQVRPVPLAEFEEVANGLEQLENAPSQIAEGARKLAAQLRAESWEDAAGNGLLKKVREGASHYYKQAIPDAARDWARQADSLIRRQVAWLVASRTIATRDLLARFDAALQPLQLAAGELEFADVTFHLARNIRLQPKEIADRLGRRTEHLLLDEFQDTAPQQWAVLKPLADHVTQPESGRTFFCVGDRKQAIYGWRGGESRIFDAIFSSFGSRVAEAPPLVESYRSSNAVLELVNAVFGKFGQLANGEKDSATQSVLSGWGREFKSHFSAYPKLLGCAEVRQVATDDLVDHETLMLRATVAEVQRLYERYPGKEIAVLLRGNTPIAKLAHLLQRAGIATSEEAGNPLTDAAAVEVILSAVTLADHPGDGPARFHVAHSPLGRHFGFQPEFANNQESNQRHAQIVAAEIRRQLLEAGYGPTVRNWARVLGEVCTEREAQRLEQLVEIAYAYDSTWTLRPQRFADYVREQRVADRTGARVRLMTMHAAKGLGFDIVVTPMMKSRSGWKSSNPQVVTGRSDPAGPIDAVSRFVRSDDRPLLPERIQAIFEEYQAQQINEELCLLYVTLTRAKQHLSVLVSPKAKPDWNNESGILLRAIADELSADTEEGLLGMWGDPNWLPLTQSPPSSAAAELSAAPWPTGGEVECPPIRLATVAQSSRGQIWNKPSSSRLTLGSVPRAAGQGRMEKSAPVAAPAVRRSLPVRSPNRDAAQQLGIAWHRLLQQVLWQETAPDRVGMLRSLGSLLADPTERKQVVEEFLSRLGRGDFAQWLSQTRVRDSVLERDYSAGRTLLEPLRLDVRRELPFVVQLEGQWLEGQIDRLVLVSEGNQLVAAQVVDFKTGPIVESELEAEAARHAPQLQIYRQAIGELFGLNLDAIATSVVFTSVTALDGTRFCRDQAV